MSRLEKSKRELETINDSVQTQLEEQLDKVQVLLYSLMYVSLCLNYIHVAVAYSVHTHHTVKTVALDCQIGYHTIFHPI